MKECIIFLDIDGVLDSYNWFRNPIRRLKKNHRTEIASYIDIRNLFWVSLLCKITKAKIVLSSSWRHGWDEFGNIRKENKGRSVVPTANLFKKWGLNIISVTPNCSNLSNTYSIDWSIIPKAMLEFKEEDTKELKENPDKFIKWSRGAEILTWLEQHKYDGNYLILEDDITDVICFDILKPHVIKTNFYGLLAGFGFRHFVKSFIQLKKTK